ncbi:phosphate ABC transporter permease subunit PstC [Desulfohalobium retbaense]|uniref:phosphate ABC transporter permease subunit PstC n=1 Tax=Desulfohalobium retbaense TaxID=45663 RepID=UPI00019B4071|nr:phosphate ABC transporter permease subunit PstC [Desulfohalobium retbaense]
MSSYLIIVCFLGVLPLGAMAYYIGRNKASAKESQEGRRLHSRPGAYGWYAVIWMAAPAVALNGIAALLHWFGLVTLPSELLVPASGVLFIAGLGLGLRTISPGLQARNIVERWIRGLLLAASLISILTTVGIVVSILFEAIKFFQLVSFWDFLTGTQWSPDTAFLGGAGRGGEAVAKPDFGSVPIFAGTFMITAIAMVVAVPIGLFAAIFMSEYATHSMRGAMKPMLEILAGIPTVVYGFFAAITVSPLVVQLAESLGLEADYTNALTPGLVMGIMIIPFVSSLSDDVISAVPQSLREGSYALGTTRSETIKQVLLPAALPGIVSAVLLAVSRALGETMIVVMAAGLRPNLTWNPLEGMTTVTVRIVDALTGDQAFDSPETLSAFGLGLVLLMVTLTLNIVSTIVIRKFKQKYE